MKKKTLKSIVKIIIPVLLILLVIGLGFVIGSNIRKNFRKQEAPAQTTADHTVVVTFPEGYTATQIARRLEESKVCTADSFLEAVSNPSQEIISSLDIENKNDRIYTLEGYLFPDTYEFYKDEEAASVVKRFLDNFNAKITPELKQKAKDAGYTFDEILTMASIVQKEAGIRPENAKVASVLYNRLETNMQIQCDVTLQYLEEYVKPYKKHYDERYSELYNTYKCKSLPAGPICSPGLATIEDTLNPADTDYLFFVTDADMNYYYAETYEQHLINCEKAGL